MKKIKEKFISLYKKYGWKAAVAIFMFYLITDGFMYIVLPWLIAKEIIFN
tara:strand:- start:1989 stop:2138 length:150 start_codon:yes stop_codon:yes gene_type:complete